MLSRVLFLLASFLFLHSFDSSFAQQVADPTASSALMLNLDQAIEYATANNAGIVAIQKRKAVADAEVLVPSRCTGR